MTHVTPACLLASKRSRMNTLATKPLVEKDLTCTEERFQACVAAVTRCPLFEHVNQLTHSERNCCSLDAAFTSTTLKSLVEKSGYALILPRLSCCQPSLAALILREHRTQKKVEMSRGVREHSADESDSVAQRPRGRGRQITS